MTSMEYGCRMLTEHGETTVVTTDHPRDPAEAMDLVGAARQTQRRRGMVAHAHLVSRHLSCDGRPIDEWHATPNPNVIPDDEHVGATV